MDEEDMGSQGGSYPRGNWPGRNSGVTNHFGSSFWYHRQWIFISGDYWMTLNDGRGCMGHILSSCKTSLTQGRYRTYRTLQGKTVVPSSGGRVLRFASTFSLENSESVGCGWKDPKGSGAETGGDSGKIIMLALEQNGSI